MKHVLTILSSSALALMLLGVCLVPAEAATLGWQVTGSSPDHPTVTEDLAAMQGNIAYVDNNLGAAVLKIPASEVSRLNMVLPQRDSVVMGVFDPYSATGTIYVSRVIRVLGQGYLYEQARVTPQQMALFSRDFEGNNPAWQFVPGQNGNASNVPYGTFVNISPSAFFTMVGLVMQHERAPQGWIASLDVREAQTTSSSGGFFKKTTTTTETAYAHPVWTAVLPSGVGVGYSEGFALPVVNQVTGQPYQSAQDVSLDSDAHTLGKPTMLYEDPSTGSFSNTQTGAYTQGWGSLKVLSGVTFEDVGAFNSLPASEFQIWQHSQSQSGFTLGGLAIFAVLLAVVTAGAALALLGALSGSSTLAMTALSALQNVGITGYGAAMAGAAGTTAAANLIYNVATGNTNYGQGAYSLHGWNALTNGWKGGQSGSVAPTPQVSAYNFQQYLASLYSTNYTAGNVQSATSLNPENPQSAWDFQPSAVNAVDSAGIMTQEPGSIGQNGTTATNSNDSPNSTPPMSISTKDVVHDAQGNVVFGDAPWGSLPSAP